MLDGRIIIVNGGTQGVGEAVARRAAALGAAGIVLTGRSRARGEAVAADLAAQGCPAEFVEVDVADPDQCRKVVAACDRRFGRVHGLVNAAGTTDRGGLLDGSVELWDRTFAINTRAPFILMQDAAKLMKRDGIAGSIVNIVTIVSHGGPPNLAVYCASKAALAILTKNAANSLRWDRIRVNGLNIGWTDTPAEHLVQTLQDGKNQDWLREAEAKQPFGRLIKPDDVARFVTFLLGGESGIMTGSVIDYDQTVPGTSG